ncbi:MAG: hypothetical protein QGF20_09370, partial [Alphaproteobacteria bacterium]|nr:hypothetical protein [Alphaproteobacteria bacterium]
MQAYQKLGWAIGEPTRKIPMSEYVRYIDKTRDYYLSQGYEKSYVWAHFEDVPFTEPPKPLAKCR